MKTRRISSQHAGRRGILLALSHFFLIYGVTLYYDLLVQKTSINKKLPHKMLLLTYESRRGEIFKDKIEMTDKLYVCF